MATKGFKFGKAICLVLVGFGIMFLGLGNAQATPLTNVSITTGEYEYLTLNGKSDNWYTEYWLNSDEFGELDAFCVEDADVDEGADYKLVGVTGVEQAALSIAKEYYYNGTGWDKEDVQIAIWELIFDDEIDLTAGNVKYTGGSQSLVKDILDFTCSASGAIALAISPRDGSPGASQDYLVNTSVPDASIMFLIGPALVMLGMMGRRRKK